MSEVATLTREMKVLNAYGIHARPAALFVKTANRFTAEINVEHKGMKVSAKSIMGLLTIEGHQGAVLTIDACGEDAVEALDTLEELFVNKFNEE